MNVEELKQKAMDVIRAGESQSIEEFFGALSSFKRNVTTATILALIAERDELAAKLDRAQSEIRALESKLLDATTKPIRICESCAIYPCKCE